ncbi:cytoplasmic tRNA 2-thiolation protein 2 [Coniochaeta pulveracea]|uniref:Cytoplasmic tRNA 2-thiolation protein 2 n=1 Tax=Coniochaeta pulveracea TaxID=177199 RepID=A0A420YJH3_9PEZI|nr:cytoplasmic tRNA 2-thiolation protein 2 [Coniochaeta pulveracea]
MVTKIEAGSQDSQPLQRPCKKCNNQEATLTSRTEPVCKDCFTQYIYLKCVRHIGLLGKETQGPYGSQPTRRYLLGLSLGTSSTILLHILNSYVEAALSKGRKSPLDLDIIVVDTSVSEQDEALQATLDAYRQRYPRLTFEVLPLTSVLGISSIDWTALPSLKQDQSPAQQLADLFERLPSTTSRADILRLFIRHILIHTALSRSCQAVLLGHSTTALAELTLAETAKGRGFSLPWQINDGVLPIEDFSPDPDNAPADKKRTIRVHHPLRELFRQELVTYTTLTEPPLTDIIPAEDVVNKASPVVSHRDLSIEEVVLRYFADVEVNYPSIVANVVKTTAKLDRLDAEERCGVCGMTLDELGDERWKGEIGDSGGGEEGAGSLCYGCERSVRG